MLPGSHIPDEEFILAMDGELEEPRAGEVDHHLERCWKCRARRARFEQAITDYIGLHHEMAGSLEPSAVPAARLRAALANEEAGSTSGPTPWWQGMRGRLALVRLAGSLAAAAVAVATGIWITAPRLVASGPLPDARLTPGAVRFITRQQVCVILPEDEGRMVPADLARRVFQQYRIADPKPRAYEVDYLISPSLGGTTALQNLWPVPYSGGVWTSRVKDALEDHLRNLVCEGKLDLATAQHEIATNWIDAYRKYFRTREPVAAHAMFTKDSPWE